MLYYHSSLNGLRDTHTHTPKFFSDQHFLKSVSSFGLQTQSFLILRKYSLYNLFAPWLPFFYYSTIILMLGLMALPSKSFLFFSTFHFPTFLFGSKREISSIHSSKPAISVLTVVICLKDVGSVFSSKTSFQTALESFSLSALIFLSHVPRQLHLWLSSVCSARSCYLWFRHIVIFFFLITETQMLLLLVIIEIPYKVASQQMEEGKMVVCRNFPVPQGQKWLSPYFRLFLGISGVMET